MKKLRQYTRPFALSLLVLFFSLTAHHNAVAVGSYTTSSYSSTNTINSELEAVAPGIVAGVYFVAIGVVAVGAFAIGFVNGWNEAAGATRSPEVAFMDNDYNSHEFSQFDN
ncbi:hypothetical protein [Hymenobacter arizonensis]|uniref:Uncharacterized protein n=1 Tax=Hymenobacter arizonensis TaxID=1227077 RepID=A0A1I6BL90_HYMAR|nr:hypothetical protein [Hymenobacter arizonensis]SFQ81695.1 hypothetical protein SAMN04515668_4713 [Hymenobacter arizonensis]